MSAMAKIWTHPGNFLVDCEMVSPKNRTIYSEGMRIPYIKRLALKLDVLSEKPLFAIADSILHGCSDELAVKLEKAPCVGALFVSPEDWRNPILGSE